MAATAAFTDLGGFAGTTFPAVGGLEDERMDLEPDVSSDHCFEGIIGKSPAIQEAGTLQRIEQP